MSGSPEEAALEFDKGLVQLQAELGVDAEAAVEVGSIVVEGPKEKCGQMALAQFLGSEHGEAQGSRIIDLAKGAITRGTEAEEAVVQALGFTVKRDNDGEVVKANPQAQESKKKAS